MICIARTGMPGEAIPWVGAILAGGQGKRLGGRDKALLPLAGRTLLDHVVERASRQAPLLAVIANGDPTRFGHHGLPVLADTEQGHLGPLAGILTAMDWAADEVRTTGWVATFAVDSPFFPADLVARLSRAVADLGGDIARATSGGRAHPVFALWPVRLRHELRKALVEEGVRGVDAWMRRHAVVQVDFPTTPFDPFFDVDTPEDLLQAERFLAEESRMAALG